MWFPVVGDLNPSPLTINLALLACALNALYMWYMRSFMGVWERLGVKTPKYEFFFGYNRATKGKGFVEIVDDYFRQYGNRVAAYSLIHRAPSLMTYDIDLLKHIMVKDFNNFVDREPELPSKSNLKTGLFFIGGDSWRRIRQLMSPIFSSGKMKMMLKHMNKTGQSMGKHLATKAKQGKLVDVKQECGHYSSELIAVLGFGLNPHAVGRDDDCEFTTHSKNLINPMPWHKSLLYIYEKVLVMFPFLFKFMFRHHLIPDIVLPSADRFFTEVLEGAIATRKVQGPNRIPDVLDLMMSAVSDSDNSNQSISKTLTHEEMIGQSKLLLFAAYETTATTLAMCLYHLAKYLEIQERVYDEIRTVIPGDTLSYKDLGQLKYTEQVINETLRLFPPLKVVNRISKETRTYEGFTIPENTHVSIHLWKIMKDPKIWENPDSFDPERFSEEQKAKRDPMTFIPFGYGPRVCLGQRLAYLALKVGLTHILKHVKLELNDFTVPKVGGDLTLMDSSFVLPEKPIKVAVTMRASQ